MLKRDDCVFQIVWSKVHKSTEKTLTGKRQFLPGLDLCVWFYDKYKIY